MKEKKVKKWTEQFFEVRSIGPEPAMTKPPWKQYRPQEIKPWEWSPGGNKESDSGSK